MRCTLGADATVDQCFLADRVTVEPRETLFKKVRMPSSGRRGSIRHRLASWTERMVAVRGISQRSGYLSDTH